MEGLARAGLSLRQVGAAGQAPPAAAAALQGLTQLLGTQEEEEEEEEEEVRLVHALIRDVAERVAATPQREERAGGGGHWQLAMRRVAEEMEARVRKRRREATGVGRVEGLLARLRFVLGVCGVGKAGEGERASLPDAMLLYADLEAEAGETKEGEEGKAGVEEEDNDMVGPGSGQPPVKRARVAAAGGDQDEEGGRGGEVLEASTTTAAAAAPGAEGEDAADGKECKKRQAMDAHLQKLAQAATRMHKELMSRQGTSSQHSKRVLQHTTKLLLHAAAPAAPRGAFSHVLAHLKLAQVSDDTLQALMTAFVPHTSAVDAGHIASFARATLLRKVLALRAPASRVLMTATEVLYQRHPQVVLQHVLVGALRSYPASSGSFASSQGGRGTGGVHQTAYVQRAVREQLGGDARQRECLLQLLCAPPSPSSSSSVAVASAIEEAGEGGAVRWTEHTVNLTLTLVQGLCEMSRETARLCVERIEACHHNNRNMCSCLPFAQLINAFVSRHAQHAAVHEVILRAVAAKLKTFNAQTVQRAIERL